MKAFKDFLVVSLILISMLAATIGLVYFQCKLTGLNNIVVGGNTVMCPK